jgi:hypothetical protein
MAMSRVAWPSPIGLVKKVIMEIILTIPRLDYIAISFA